MQTKSPRLRPLAWLLLFIVSTSTAQTATETPAALPEPLEFPRTVSSDAGSVVVHTPQIDAWPNFERIEGRFAIAVTPAGESEAVLGVAEFTADTDPNLVERVVAVENIEISVTSFPIADDERRSQLDDVVRATVRRSAQYVPLDVILSYIAPEATVYGEDGLSFEPPPIFYSSTPAVLLMTDGEPLLAPLPDTRLEYVVNTNWDLFRYREREWYLRLDDRWLTSATLDGNWRWDNRLPRDFSKLPDDGNWVETVAAIPPAKGDDPAPTVFVSDRPAELIVTNGLPSRTAIGGQGLSYVPNTESDLFRYKDRYYYLVSGRWFSARQLRGPWDHVRELPTVFAEIPADSEKGHVLAAIAGTDEARLAVLEASLPRKALVSREAAETVNVFFRGEPEFEPIPGTSVERATNSYNDILKVGNVFYLCDNAVWYSATSVDGPWRVALEVPDAIYAIPPSSPSYHVTHVHVYDHDDDYVQTGYTSGYFGVHIGFGIAMYGSGWYYPSYYGYYPYGGYAYYPYYFPYPYSYGGSAWYNPVTGRYGRSAVAYGPYGGFGRSASYNPRTGTYARGRAVWDSNEIAGSGVAYNPRTGTGVATHRYASEKGGWGESLIAHNERWLQTRSEWTKNSASTQFRTSEGLTGEINRQRSGDTVTGSGEFQRGDGSLTTRSIRNEDGAALAGQTGDGTRFGVGRNAAGDLYAGTDGNVYRRTDAGWERNTGDGWNVVDVPDDRAAQIDRARESAMAERDGRLSSAAQERSSRVQTFENSGGLQMGRNVSRSPQMRGSLDSNRNWSGFDRSRRSELNRSFNARSNGYQRYNTRSGNFAGNLQQIDRPRRRRP